VKRLWKPLLILGLVVLIGIGYWVARLVWFHPFNIDHFFERAYVEFLWEDPEALTATGILNDFGFKGHHGQLTDASPGRARQLAEIGKRNLELLQHYDREALREHQQLSYDIFLWYLKTGVAGEPFLFHDYPITHLSGPHLELPQFMVHTHPISSPEEAQQYVARLGSFDSKFGQVIDALAYRADLQMIAPTFILQKAIQQCDEFVAVAPEKCVLHTAFLQKIEKLGLDESQKAELSQQCLEQIIEKVYPAYKRLSGYMLQLESGSMSVVGAWHLPDGDAYYRYCLLQHTTMQVDPDSLYAFGKAEMERIEREMRVLFNLLRYPADASTASILQEFTKDRTVTFGNDSAGRIACLAHFQRTTDVVSLQLDRYFRFLPVAALEIRELPENRATSSPLAFYLPPKGDPLGAGRMFVNTHKADHLPYFLATTYAYHEGIPGHHLQKAIQMEMKEMPQFRRFLPFEAFTEGWAMYAEELGHEMTNSEDPYDKIGLLQSDMFRTARMMTDIGLHHKKWLRDQAVSFMQQNAGLDKREAEEEVDRYIVWPGQGCAYKVGKMKFMQLRKRAEKTNGFDLPAFHEMLIGNGAMPLDVLGARMERFVDR